MKRVINGKVYNTNTAEELHSYWNHRGAGDFQYLSEDLYKTKKGNFFLAGEGGAMTKYSQSCGENSVCGGSGIHPLDPDEALEWAENHGMSAYKIAEHFEVVEA